MDDKATLKELVKIRKALEGIEAVLKYALVSHNVKNEEKKE